VLAKTTPGKTAPPKSAAPKSASAKPAKTKTAMPATERPTPQPKKLSKKLSYREQQDLQALPAKIEALETEQVQLTAAIAEPGFYTSGAAAIAATMDRLGAVQAELLDVYARWSELDSRASG
jgi:ATP-binding cassette subfamily F protein uup